MNGQWHDQIDEVWLHKALAARGLCFALFNYLTMAFLVSLWTNFTNATRARLTFVFSKSLLSVKAALCCVESCPMLCGNMAHSPYSCQISVRGCRALPHSRYYVTIHPFSCTSSHLHKDGCSPLVRLTCCFFRTIRYRSLFSCPFLTPVPCDYRPPCQRQAAQRSYYQAFNGE